MFEFALNNYSVNMWIGLSPDTGVSIYHSPAVRHE
jgi:hypothetical protein